MNNAFTFVLLIIALVMLARVVETYLKQRKTIPEGAGGIEDMLDKIGLLEERIRVLERIVTDRNVDLKQQIDDL